MIKKPITIRISNGLEARPVAMLVQVASQCEKYYGNDDPRSGQWRRYYGDRQRRRRAGSDRRY